MYDLVIRNGKIYDGTGAPAFDGDVAIEGDRIVAVGTLDDAQIGAETEMIEAAGRMCSRASSTPTPTTTGRSPGIPSSLPRPTTV